MKKKMIQRGQFRRISGVMLPCFQVLDIHIKFQCLHTDLGNQRLIKVVSQ